MAQFGRQSFPQSFPVVFRASEPGVYAENVRPQRPLVPSSGRGSPSEPLEAGDLTRAVDPTECTGWKSKSLLANRAGVSIGVSILVGSKILVVLPFSQVLLVRANPHRESVPTARGPRMGLSLACSPSCPAVRRFWCVLRVQGPQPRGRPRGRQSSRLLTCGSTSLPSRIRRITNLSMLTKHVVAVGR